MWTCKWQFEVYQMTVLTTIDWLFFCAVLKSLIRTQSNHSLTLRAAHLKEQVTRASKQSQNDKSCRSSQTITVHFGAQLHANYHSALGRM